MSEGPPPAGKLVVTVTHLAMTAPPNRGPRPAPLHRLALLRAEQPTLSFYRYLYDTVGEPWLWSDRRAMDQEALRAIITDERTSILVLYLAGVPAGFAELFRRPQRITQILYFGLVPDFFGRRLGSFLLDAAIDAAWAEGAERLEVETCTLDHPRALGLYQRAGFSPFRQEVEHRDDPRALGLIPPHVAPQHPFAGILPLRP
jgi:GNAT superfamily N-acetyltransferase